MPDPGASYCDAFSFSWLQFRSYAFPPFAMINKVVSKICQEKCSVVILVPEWPTQAWFSKLMKIKTDIMFIPNSGLENPVKATETHPRGRLMAVGVSWNV